MPLISASGLIADPWIRAADDGDFPVSAPALRPLARLVKDGDRLAGHAPPVGAEIPGNTDFSLLEPWLPRLELIAVRFPVFSDGRGFSLGRTIRLAGYTHELRATGPLIADQFSFALACGFDTVEIGDEVGLRQPIDQWLAAAKVMSVTYQRGYDGPLNALDARRRAHRPARSAAGGAL